MIVVNNVPIEIHADDFGQTINTSKEILELMKNGHLDGISILPNMSVFDKCIELYEQTISELPFIPLMSIHLDLVEGKMLSETGNVPWTWKGLFINSYIPTKSNKELFNRIKEEIRYQIERAQHSICKIRSKAKDIGVYDTNNNEISLNRIRIDSHQHTHMIPIVWRALIEVIEEEEYTIEFVRDSHELKTPFLNNYKQNAWSPINLVKNIILSIYAPRVERYAKKSQAEYRYLWGLIMSGHMDIIRIKRVMPDMVKKCEDRQMGIEMNFHPGLMLKGEFLPEIPKQSVEKFYLSENRKIEYAAVTQMHDYLRSLL